MSKNPDRRMASDSPAAGLAEKAALTDAPDNDFAHADLPGQDLRVLEHLPDAIVMINSLGKIVYANSPACTLFGYTDKELSGQSLEILIPERFRDSHVHQRAGYAAKPHIRPMGTELELYGLRKDATEFPVDISLSAIEHDGKRFVVSAIRDITERKALEHSLKQKNAELQMANRELEFFAYSVSHDLRAPLRALGGFADLLASAQGDALNEEARRHLDRIQTNAVKMSRLVDGLLSFSRFGRQALRKRPLQPAEIVRRVVAELQSEQEGREINLAIGELPPCEADPLLLHQVFLNLLSNAFKYTRGRNPAQIEVGCQPDGAYFVKDNGVGFEMEYAEKLFGVFQRLHHEDQFEGTGVGLAIVQRIVQRHGGKIWADARPEFGATFFFTLDGAE